MKLCDKKLFLLDMDGTLYLDNDLFDGTIDFLNQVKLNGGRYLFVTNNSSKSTDVYVSKLKRLGIEADHDDFLTSTDATIIYLTQKFPGRKFYCIGTKSFEEQLKAAGVIITTEREDDVFGIIMGNDNELTFKKLEDACILLLNDIEYIATNPDWVCPTSFGYVPDCGSIAEMLWRATGKKPIFIGKPQPEMLNLAIEKFGYSKDECVMIGDRVYTDIAAGYNAGVDTVFVLSGEGTMADLKTTSTPPTYIRNNIKEVFEEIKNI
jgi:HAD superfamily hydrolase (TIGR01457 family)